MRTALDTNVVSALWSEEPPYLRIAAELRTAGAQGGLVIAAPVYAELLAYPYATLEFLERFLDGAAIEVDFELKPEVWRESGRRFARFASRRRRAKAGHPQRLLADFIIGAHALLHADRLLTLDVVRYRRDFPELRLITIPS